MLYLLDTSALLAHHRKEPGWSQVQAIFDDPEADVFIASISLAELARRLGKLGADEAERRGIVSAYALLMTDVVSVDREVAMEVFEISCRTPKPLPLMDALIASAARVRGACLVHRNEHLSPIPLDLVPQLQLTAAADPE